MLDCGIVGGSERDRRNCIFLVAIIAEAVPTRASHGWGIFGVVSACGGARVWVGKVGFVNLVLTVAAIDKVQLILFRGGGLARLEGIF